MVIWPLSTFRRTTFRMTTDSVPEMSGCEAEAENHQSSSDSENDDELFEDCLSKNTSPAKSDCSVDGYPSSDDTYYSSHDIESAFLELDVLSISGDGISTGHSIDSKALCPSHSKATDVATATRPAQGNPIHSETDMKIEVLLDIPRNSMEAVENSNAGNSSNSEAIDTLDVYDHNEQPPSDSSDSDWILVKSSARARSQSRSRAQSLFRADARTNEVANFCSSFQRDSQSRRKTTTKTSSNRKTRGKIAIPRFTMRNPNANVPLRNPTHPIISTEPSVLPSAVVRNPNVGTCARVSYSEALGNSVIAKRDVRTNFNPTAEGFDHPIEDTFEVRDNESAVASISDSLNAESQTDDIVQIKQSKSNLEPNLSSRTSSNCPNLKASNSYRFNPAVGTPVRILNQFCNSHGETQNDSLPILEGEDSFPDQFDSDYTDNSVLNLPSPSFPGTNPLLGRVDSRIWTPLEQSNFPGTSRSFSPFNFSSQETAELEKSRSISADCESPDSDNAPPFFDKANEAFESQSDTDTNISHTSIGNETVDSILKENKPPSSSQRENTFKFHRTNTSLKDRSENISPPKSISKYSFQRTDNSGNKFTAMPNDAASSATSSTNNPFLSRTDDKIAPHTRNPFSSQSFPQLNLSERPVLKTAFLPPERQHLNGASPHTPNARTDTKSSFHPTTTIRPVTNRTLPQTHTDRPVLNSDVHRSSDHPVVNRAVLQSTDHLVVNRADPHTSTNRAAVSRVISKHSTDRQVVNRTVSEHSTDRPVGNRTVSEHSTERPFVNRTVSEHSTDHSFVNRTVSEHSTNRPFVNRTVSEHSTDRPVGNRTISEHSADRTVMISAISKHSTDRPAASRTVSERSTDHPVRYRTVSKHSTDRPAVNRAVSEHSTDRSVVHRDVSGHSKEHTEVSSVSRTSADSLLAGSAAPHTLSDHPNSAISRASTPRSVSKRVIHHTSTDRPVSSRAAPPTSANCPVVNSSVPHTSTDPRFSDSANPNTSADHPVSKNADPHNSATNPVVNITIPHVSTDQPVSDFNAPSTSSGSSVVNSGVPRNSAVRPVTSSATTHTFPGHPISHHPVLQTSNQNFAPYFGPLVESPLAFQMNSTQPRLLQQPGIFQYPQPANHLYQPMWDANRSMGQPFPRYPYTFAFSHPPAYPQPGVFVPQVCPRHSFVAQTNHPPVIPQMMHTSLMQHASNHRYESPAAVPPNFSTQRPHNPPPNPQAAASIQTNQRTNNQRPNFPTSQHPSSGGQQYIPSITRYQPLPYRDYWKYTDSDSDSDGSSPFTELSKSELDLLNRDDFNRYFRRLGRRRDRAANSVSSAEKPSKDSEQPDDHLSAEEPTRRDAGPSSRSSAEEEIDLNLPRSEENESLSGEERQRRMRSVSEKSNPMNTRQQTRHRRNFRRSFSYPGPGDNETKLPFLSSLSQFPLS